MDPPSQTEGGKECWLARAALSCAATLGKADGTTRLSVALRLVTWPWIERSVSKRPYRSPSKR